MKKAWASTELVRLLVKRSTDPLAKPSLFYCQLCQLDFSVLTQGSSEFYGIIRAQFLLPRINNCVWRHLAGEYLISMEIR